MIAILGWRMEHESPSLIDPSLSAIQFRNERHAVGEVVDSGGQSTWARRDCGPDYPGAIVLDKTALARYRNPCQTFVEIPSIVKLQRDDHLAIGVNEAELSAYSFYSSAPFGETRRIRIDLRDDDLPRLVDLPAHLGHPTERE
jgi:hypothetical protein